MTLTNASLTARPWASIAHSQWTYEEYEGHGTTQFPIVRPVHAPPCQLSVLPGNVASKIEIRVCLHEEVFEAIDAGLFVNTG